MGRLATILLVLLLAGCSLVFPKFKAPQLTVVSAQVQKGDFWTQRMKLRVRVENPNNRTLPVKGLEYTLELDGQPFAEGESATSFVVPAGGEAEFDTTVKVNLASTLTRLLTRDRDQTVEYHLKGKVSLSAGLWRSIRFDQHGSFRPQDLLAR
jgi:LEA14-like dessication related protein